MTITIGRFSTTADLANLMVDGDRVSFTLDLIGSTVEEMKAFRQQLLGLVDNEDEDIVRFTWSEDSTFDGFYRPVSVQVGSTEVMLSTGTVADGAQIVLERVTGYANPWFEVTTATVVRTNGHGVTAPTAVVAMTPGFTGITDISSVLALAGAALVTRVADTLNSWDVRRATAPVSTTSWRIALQPTYYYDAACVVEYRMTVGGAWYIAHGRQLPRNVVQWRISNGFVRLTSAEWATGSVAGTFEVFDGVSAWESQNVWHPDPTVGPPKSIGAPNGVATQATLLRNSPEGVVIRADGNDLSFTYRIARGERVIGFSYTSSTAVNYGAGFSTGSLAACTLSSTGVIIRTAADANGNKMAFGTAAAMSADLGNGYAYQTSSAKTGSGWFGCDLGAAFGALTLQHEFLAATTQRQRIVTR